MKQQQKRRSIISHKTYMSWDAVDLMNYFSSRSSWVKLLQESPAGTIEKKKKKAQLICFNQNLVLFQTP